MLRVFYCLAVTVVMFDLDAVVVTVVADVGADMVVMVMVIAAVGDGVIAVDVTVLCDCVATNILVDLRLPT